MSQMNVGQGPPRTRPPREELVGRKKTDLWFAVWEASQFLSYDEIREHVERTLAEIHSDSE